MGKVGFELVAGEAAELVLDGDARRRLRADPVLCVVSNIVSLDGSQIIPAGVSHESHLDSLPQRAINGPRELR